MPQSALVHVDTPPARQILAEPPWAKKLTDEDQRGPTPSFWPDADPYGALRLDMDKRLDLGLR